MLTPTLLHRTMCNSLLEDNRLSLPFFRVVNKLSLEDYCIFSFNLNFFSPSSFWLHTLRKKILETNGEKDKIKVSSFVADKWNDRTRSFTLMWGDRRSSWPFDSYRLRWQARCVYMAASLFGHLTNSSRKKKTRKKHKHKQDKRKENGRKSASSLKLLVAILVLVQHGKRWWGVNGQRPRAIYSVQQT